MTKFRCSLLMLLIPLAALSAQSVFAEINTSAGTSGFSFLKINPGARAVGMGGAFTGLANDETALYYNPAGLTEFEEDRFILEYHNYFMDMQSGMVGYTRPFGLNRTLGFHVSYLNYGDFTETDLDGNVLGEFGGGDYLFGATLAVKRSQRFSLGVTAKFLYEKIQDYSATGVAMDLGLRYTSDRGRYSGGLVIQNLGTQLSALGEGDKDALPTVLRVGGSARLKGLPMVFVGDLIVPFDNDIDFALGAEYFSLKPLLLRLGWNTFGSNYRIDDSDDNMAGLAMGAGFMYHALQISYAFTPAADLGESHRITLTGGI